MYICLKKSSEMMIDRLCSGANRFLLSAMDVLRLGSASIVNEIDPFCNFFNCNYKIPGNKPGNRAL